MSSIQNVAEMLANIHDNIHKDLQNLDTIIPDDPIKDDHQFTSINDTIDHIVAEINRTKDLIKRTRQEALQEDEERSEEPLGIFEDEKILAKTAAKEAFEVSYEKLDPPEKNCFHFLSIFPKNAIIKRRTLIYCWIGERLINKEEDGEAIFKKLLKLGLTIPYGNGKSPHVNKCKVYLNTRCNNLFNFGPSGSQLFDSESSITCRRACLVESLSHKNGWDNGNLSTIFNVSMKYVNFDFSQAKLEKLVVLQLGQWQHHRKHHIELKSDVILRDVGAHKYLKYLGLRQVSMISSLPPTIFNLINLEILDLKACYNLEKLSPCILSLKKLTHLDVSECYFLESMPKGIEKLTSLQVLKGHVIRSSTSTPCKIGLLRNLKKLKRLSIHLEKQDMEEGKKFNELKELKPVKYLKISWSSNFPQNKIESFSFPPKLEKLELENLPHDGMPQWLNPQALLSLKKLCIKGGKLSSLNHSEKITDEWKVEHLCLKYLRNLRIGLPYVKKLFPELKYVQKFYEGGYELETSQKIRSYGEFEWRKEASD